MQNKMKKCPNRPDNVAKDIYILVDKAGMDQRPTRSKKRQGGPKQRMFVKVYHAFLFLAEQLCISFFTFFAKYQTFTH